MDNLINLADRFRRRSTGAGTLLDVLRDGRDATGVDFRTYEEVADEDKPILLVGAARALKRPLSEPVARVANHVLSWAWDGLTWSADAAAEFLAAVAEVAALDADVSGALAVGIRDAVHAAGPGGDASASRAAVRVLDLTPPGEHGVLDRFTRFHRLALARIASPARDEAAFVTERGDAAQQPIALLELDGIVGLSADLRFDLAELDLYSAVDHSRRLARRAAAARLGQNADYAAAAEAVAAAVVRRLEAIHTGKLPYQPDHAFAEREIEAAVRAHAVGATVDAPWFTDAIAPTLSRLAVAPTAAKTVPSQSLIIRLAHEVADSPLPESVAALAVAAHDVRHAGVKKKVDHDLRAARKALVAAPRTTMRDSVPRTAHASRAEATALRARIEASFEGEPHPVVPWLDDLLADPVLAAIAGAVIWQLDGGATVMWRGGEPTNADGVALSLPPAVTVRPWHPAVASANEREAWRRFIVRHAIRQPFRQAFREWYRPAEVELGSSRTHMFRGLVVSIRPFLGVAHREGWTVASTDGPVRRESRSGLAVEIEADGHLYPGAVGWATLGSVRFQQFDRRWRDVLLGDLDPMALSEALRAVDLLASVAAYAVSDDEDHGQSRFEHLSRLEKLPLTAQARVRREVIAQVLRDWPGSDRVTYDERFARIATERGELRVHYATGLAVDVDGRVLPRAAGVAAVVPLPWLPYDETLLDDAVATIVGILATQ